MKIKLYVVLLIGILVIPTLVFSSTTIRMDMDANTTGLQTEIWLLPGNTFTSNIELVMDGGDSLSSFGYSLQWDIGELNTPVAGDISTFALAGGWTDVGFDSIASPNIFNFAQYNASSSSSGPSTTIIASINWTVSSAITDAGLDIWLGEFHVGDSSWDAGFSKITPVFEGGNVSLAPEPISSILFLTGGVTLGLRQYRKRKK